MKKQKEAKAAGYLSPEVTEDCHTTFYLCIFLFRTWPFLAATGTLFFVLGRHITSYQIYSRGRPERGWISGTNRSHCHSALLKSLFLCAKNKPGVT